MALQRLVNVQGPLAETVPQIEPGTWQESAEITSARRDHRDLRDKWFFTADFAMYTVENDGAILYLGGREPNPILRDVAGAAAQLLSKGNYVPRRQSIEAVLGSAESGGTLRAVLAALDLKGDDTEWR